MIRTVALFGVTALGCSDTTTAPDVFLFRAPRVNGTVAVTATNPAYAHRNETGVLVTVSGSGFDAGSTVQWQRNGTPAAGITVRGVQYISATALTATIDVAGDAELTLYDVAVTNSDRKQGIGTEMFEVTTAVVLGASCSSDPAAARGINTAGQIAGNNCGNAFYWDATAGMVHLGVGVAWGIDEAGMVIAGRSTANGPDAAAVWSRASASAAWTLTKLPNSATASQAWGLASDANGNAAIVSGNYATAVSKRTTADRPALWFYRAGSWQLTQLPIPTGGAAGSFRVHDVNAAGQAAGGDLPGGSYGKAVVWEPNPDGSYAATGLPGAGQGRGISPDGNTVVGLANGRAVYWTRSNGVWSGPVMFEQTTCNTETYASRVNADGMVAARACDGAHIWRISGGVVVSSRKLAGIGNRISSANGSAWGLNNGLAPQVVGMPGEQTAVRWDLF